MQLWRIRYLDKSQVGMWCVCCPCKGRRQHRCSVDCLRGALAGTRSTRFSLLLLPPHPRLHPSCAAHHDCKRHPDLPNPSRRLTPDSANSPLLAATDCELAGRGVRMLAGRGVRKRKIEPVQQAHAYPVCAENAICATPSSLPKLKNKTVKKIAGACTA